MLDHKFGSGPPLTVGVEEEYMLLDPDSFDLTSGVEPLLDDAAGSEFSDRLKPELMQCVLESGTVVCKNIAEADADLRALRGYSSERARARGMRLGRGRNAPVLAVRAPEDHRPRPLPDAGRHAPVRGPP